MNELLLLLSLIISYGSVLIWFRLFGKEGMYCFTILATIMANIEVLALVNAFGIEMTLGNILFATTFIATDILSETEGKKCANKAVKLGIATSATFIIVSRLWLYYIPSSNDMALTAIKQLFASTPRIMAASFLVYAVAQALDVYLYHKIWEYTEKRYKSRKSLLWVRNNVATISSQLINSVLYNLLAFYGIYSSEILGNIIISTFAISIITSLLDTPIIYCARYIAERQKESQ